MYQKRETFFLVLTYILKIYKIIIGEFNEKKNI